jgi:NAD(P)-dependent dehydrogenase (short-subunit alcohol dehydrogenase family)
VPAAAKGMFMSKTIIVVGYGPGISTGVAETFGAKGFNVALVGRTKERLDAGVAALKARGITAGGFVADAGDPASITSAIDAVRTELGAIHALHWNAYGEAAGDLTSATPDEIGGIFDVAITGLLAALQAALPDLKANKGALLVTNGAFGDLDPQVDAFAASSNYMGLALANAAKHKLVGLLSARLKDEGVHVGEVTIAGAIKGTAWATGNPNAIEPSAVGEAFHALFEGRSETYRRLS